VREILLAVEKGTGEDRAATDHLQTSRYLSKFA
jgi:hypothetical protein